MLLVVDIGNSNIVFGIYKNQNLITKFRLITLKTKSANDYSIDIVENLLNCKIKIEDISNCIIGSVVPSIDNAIENALQNFLSAKIFIAGKNIKLDIETDLKNKEEIGADRLINSISAYRKFGGNLIIIDFGTATTLDVVGANGEYLGGIIAPGIKLSLKALYDMTDKLPQISIHQQKNVIGKNTVEAMNSGVYYGYIGLIEGVINRIENEIFPNKPSEMAKIIITGGLGEIFEKEISSFLKINHINKKLENEREVHYIPDLTLQGLKIIFDEAS